MSVYIKKREKKTVPTDILIETDRCSKFATPKAPEINAWILVMVRNISMKYNPYIYCNTILQKHQSNV